MTTNLTPTDLFMRRIKSIEGMHQGALEVLITFDDGSTIHQYHEQDCCENVEVEQVDGLPSKFIGAIAHELLEKTNEGETDYDHQTYTFYTLKTSKGYLDWRWLGESNGYYSESVECKFKTNKE